MRFKEQDAPFASGLWLALIGLAGFAGAITLGLMTLFGSHSAIAVAIALYGAGFVAVVLVTAGATLAPPLLWMVRLIAPLIGPVIVVLTAMAL